MICSTSVTIVVLQIISTNLSFKTQNFTLFLPTSSLLTIIQHLSHLNSSLNHYSIITTPTPSNSLTLSHHLVPPNPLSPFSPLTLSHPLTISHPPIFPRYSDNLWSVAEKMKWWSPKTGTPLNFLKTYAPQRYHPR